MTDPVEDPRPPLSCYIRTLNEARMIGPVVEAALQVAREVVVVDSGSTDDTVALARRSGARVVDQPWLGNGRQKRAGEDACAHDWLLDLDADEIVTPELASAIAALFDPAPSHKVYRIKMLNQPAYGPLQRGYNHTWRAKLYDRRAHRMPDHKAWDQLEVSGGVDIGAIDAPIIHNPFVNVEHKMAKMNRISTVRARESRLKSHPAILLRVYLGFPFYLLRALLVRGMWRGGAYGFVNAMTNAMARWLRDAKMLERSMDARRKADGDPR